jgi:hypothetical protein
MRWARALALVAAVCAAPAAGAVPVERSLDETVARWPAARPGVSAHADPSWVMPLPRAGLFIEARSRKAERDGTRGRGLLLGYLLRSPRAQVQFRAGYRYGLPLAEAEVFDDPGLVLTSGSSVGISAGTVAWLQLDLDGFREIAGSRIMRLEAVPGLRFRFGDAVPWEAGFGLLAGFRPASGAAGLAIERFAGVVQLSGRF